MTQAVAAQMGSGTLPYTYGILPPSERGNETGSRGVRQGIQVMVANPEDLVAVDAFAASGVTVGTAVVEIVGPLNNPLPRCREIIVENAGAADVYLSHLAEFSATDAFELPAATAGRSSRVRFPVLYNVPIYARTTTGTASIRLLIF